MNPILMGLLGLIFILAVGIVWWKCFEGDNDD